jgi:hypothetical protein
VTSEDGGPPRGRSAPDGTALLALLDLGVQPLRRPAYRFTRAWVQERTRPASDPCIAASCTQRRLTAPPRHLLIQRVDSGLVSVLCSLDATVDAEVRRRRPTTSEVAGRPRTSSRTRTAPSRRLSDPRR